MKRVLPTLLDDYKPFIREMLEKHSRLRATRLFHMVKPRGYQGGYEPVKRYVREVRPTGRTEAFFRIETLPGEEAQVDWGLFGKLKVGRRREAAVLLHHGVVALAGGVRALRARHDDGKLSARPRLRLRGAGWGAQARFVRQPEVRGAGTVRRRGALPPSVAGARRALPLRTNALCPVPGE